MSTLVRRELTGSVLSLVLDAPARRNALSRDMLGQLASELAYGHTGVTGIVISGAGAAFSAGADFGDLTGTSTDTAFDDAVERVTKAIAASPVPVLAAVEGPCLGAGAHLALACDMRVAGQGSHIQVPAVRLGLLYSPLSVAWLAGAYPRDTVRRLLLLGERFDAAEAREAGLFSTVVPDGTARERAVELLSVLAPEHLAALAATRELLTVLESGNYNDAAWQQWRRDLLDSPARARSVRQAQARHNSAHQQEKQP